MKNVVSVMVVLFLLYTLVPAQDKTSSAKLKEIPTSSEAEQLVTEAVTLSHIGKFDEAIALVKRSLEIREKLSTSDDATFVAYLDYLARLYRAKGEYDNALTLYLRMLKIQETKLASTDFELAKILKQSACMLRRNKRKDEAKVFDERANKIIYKDIANTHQIIRGKVLSKPAPIYPDAAKRKGITGEVYVELIFDETGKVVHACAMQGDPILSLSAEQAAMRAPLLAGNA
jgi:tetratricopeptide (TPR) repeat protein